MRSYQTKNVSIRLCDEFNNEKRQRIGVLADTYCIFANNLILARTIWKTAARERRSYCISGLAMRNMTLKIEGKADQTAQDYQFFCSIFRLNKTSLHQGLEKLGSPC